MPNNPALKSEELINSIRDNLKNSLSGTEKLRLVNQINEIRLKDVQHELEVAKVEAESNPFKGDDKVDMAAIEGYEAAKQLGGMPNFVPESMAGDDLLMSSFKAGARRWVNENAVVDPEPGSVITPEPEVTPEPEATEQVPSLSIPEGWYAVTEGITQEGDYTLEGVGSHNKRYEPIKPEYIGEDVGGFFGVARKISQSDEPNEQENQQTEVTAETEAGGSEGDSIEITGKELGYFPDTEEGKKALRKAANSALDLVRREWFPCPALGGDVEIRKDGIKKIISTSADSRKLKIVSKLPELIFKGKKVGERDPYDGDKDISAVAYFTLRAEFMLEGVSLAARLVVKEDNNGKFHYDHSIHDQEVVFDGVTNKNSSPTEAGLESVTTSNGGGTYPSRLASYQLEKSVQQETEIVNIGHTLDSVGSGKLVLNLFIEGEDPEVVGEDTDSDSQPIEDGNASEQALIDAYVVPDRKSDFPIASFVFAGIPSPARTHFFGKSVFACLCPISVFV